MTTTKEAPSESYMELLESYTHIFESANAELAKAIERWQDEQQAYQRQVIETLAHYGEEATSRYVPDLNEDFSTEEKKTAKAAQVLRQIQEEGHTFFSKLRKDAFLLVEKKWDSLSQIEVVYHLAWASERGLTTTAILMQIAKHQAAYEKTKASKKKS